MVKSPRRAVFVALVSALLCPAPYGVAEGAAPLPPPQQQQGAVMVPLPGPLRSFLRMAGLSQKAEPSDVLPLLSRAVFIHGYQSGRPTEYLILLDRYVAQARELQTFAGSSNLIEVNGCRDAGALLQILGYRVRRGCSEKTMILETADPERAFLTTDSGFPLMQLEESLQKGEPFRYPYAPSWVPAMLHESDWITSSTTRRRGASNLLDAILDDSSVARLYWAMSRLDLDTRQALSQSPGLRRLLPVAPTLDFYGSQLRIRNGRILTPGGPAAEPVWKDLVGAAPTNPGEFTLHLLSKDRGWLAVYFDAIQHVNQAQQAHFTEPTRLKRLYTAFRPAPSEPEASRSVFRKSPILMILCDRLVWDADGNPHVPGGVGVWKEILNQKEPGKLLASWNKRVNDINSPDALLDAMMAVSRSQSEASPLRLYLLASEIDAARGPGKQLSESTVRSLNRRYADLADWYPIFAEFPELDDTSVERFLTIADAVDGVSNQTLRGNILGSFEATVGLWQIFARQGQISLADRNASWQKVLSPYTAITSPTQLFVQSHESINQLMLAASGQANRTQQELVQMLAGPPQPTEEGQRLQAEMAARLNSVLDDQRLVSLDTLFALGDGLHDMAEGANNADKLVPLAESVRDFELPRPIYTNNEKIAWAPRSFSARHAELQIRTDLSRVIKAHATPAQLETARGQLAPFLRDTLVGLNYAYYEPPGAQMLHHNPLFVRAHDFTSTTIATPERSWHSAELFGVGSPAGGGAYLAGSLAGLPYSLAQTEQNFIAPENTQALIWQELVPSIMVGSTLSHWWNVTPNELHAVTLYQRTGEELLSASMKNPALREKTIGILLDRLTSQQLSLVEVTLEQGGDIRRLIAETTPADLFYLAAEFRRRYPSEASSPGPSAMELETLSHQAPGEVNMARLSSDFGVPHPVLASSYSRSLNTTKPFPFFGGGSNRLFGESWDSNNLYWARLADEMGYHPAVLNRLIPQLTQRMTAKIFASNIQDWAALQRAMQETGEEFRGSKSTTAFLTTPGNTQ